MSQTKAQLISDLVQALNFTGTASAPANGAFLSATNTLQLSTASTPRLTINSDGHVDVVGNLDVGAGIDVTGNITGTQDIILSSGGSERLNMTHAGGGQFVIKNPSAAALSFGTNNQNNELFIANGGNVGIGTSSPETLLHAKINTFSDDINKVALTLSNNQSSGVHQYFQNASTGTGVSNGARIGLGNTDNFLIQHFEAKDIQISTNATERMRINSSGNVGIGTSSPGETLHILKASANHGIKLERTTSNAGSVLIQCSSFGVLALTADNNIQYKSGGSQQHIFYKGSDEIARFDTSKRLLIGTSSGTGHSLTGTNNPLLQVESASSNDYARASFIFNGATSIGPGLWFGKSRGTSVGSNTIVNDGDQCGGFFFHAADGTDKHSRVASIEVKVDGTPGSNDTPGRITFATTADGASGTTERLRIDSSGKVGIGTQSPDFPLDTVFTNANSSSFSTSLAMGSGANGDLYALHLQNLGTGNCESGLLFSAGNTQFGQWSLNCVKTGAFVGDLAFRTRTGSATSAERMRIDSGGNLVLNSDTVRVYNGHTPKLSVQGNNFSESTVSITSNSNGSDGAYLFFAKQRSGSAGGSTAVANNDLVGQFRYLAGDGTDLQSEVANITVSVDGTPGSNDTPGRITFATTNDGGSTSSERMRITNAGHVHIGNGHGNANHRINGNGFTQGQTFLVISAYSSSAQDTAIFFGVDSGGGNTASCGLKMGRNSSNSRSINAGGTVNASGTDYAEYMTKSSDFTLAKGAICGINAEGKLTNKFSESISFVVKSTDPSYVGGDTWGSEDILGKKPKDKSSELPAYEEKMEAARKMVDRIAFSGQVPVNVTGTTPGQHIIPTLGTDDSITGVAKAEASLSMAEYISSVGKVVALESDGRARIIVKVA